MSRSDLLCVEMLHVYLDEKTSEQRVRRQIEPTAIALVGLLVARRRAPWRPLVVIDDYFDSHRPLSADGQAILPRKDRRELESAFMGWANTAWFDCWVELGDLGGPAFRGAAPPLTFVRESDFEPLAWSLCDALVPRLRRDGAAGKQRDASAWRRAPWTAGPVGAWLANGRPPRSAPSRRGDLQLLHSALDLQTARKHSIHLDVELFDCDACRLGGRCDGFGRCDATIHHRPHLRMSCPALAAALHLARVSSVGTYAASQIPTVELHQGTMRYTGRSLEPASRAVSAIGARFIEVEHAVAVILDHLPVDLPRPTYVFLSDLGA